MIISIDIETTGLDYVNHQILDFAAVKANGDSYQTFLKHESLVGDPYALSLNKEILNPKDGISADELYTAYGGWTSFERNLIVGKNFGSFDQLFLTQLNPLFKELFGYSYLDVGSLYFDPKVDTKIPNLEECLRRIGAEPSNLHTALGDAQDVMKLYKAYYGT